MTNIFSCGALGLSVCCPSSLCYLGGNWGENCGLQIFELFVTLELRVNLNCGSVYHNGCRMTKKELKASWQKVNHLKDAAKDIFHSKTHSFISAHYSFR